jgi:hypothetical protein
MNDLVDRKRCNPAVRLPDAGVFKFTADSLQPLLEYRLGTRVQCRKASDDAGRALRDHEIRVADDEKRRPDRRQS